MRQTLPNREWPRVRVKGWLAGVLLLVACTPGRMKIDGDAVRRIRIEGNGGAFSGHNDLQLTRTLSQRPSATGAFTFPFMYFTTPSTLSMETLKTDAKRLEVWYAHHGWFDMRFMGWQVRRVRRAWPDRAGVVDLIGSVEPGPQSALRDIRWTGLRSSDASATVVRAAQRAVDLQVGDPFDLEAIEAAKGTVINELRNNGHAYADIEVRIDAWPEEEEVEVELEVQPGRLARFGEVRIEGLKRVDRELVLASLAFREGRLFSVDAIAKSRSRLFGTRLFSLVDVRPDLSDSTSERVPITLQLTEAKFRRVRLGAGLRYDSFNLIPNLDVQFQDVYLAGTRLQLDVEAGVGATLGLVRDDDGRGTTNQPTALGEVRLSYPWFLTRGSGDLGRYRKLMLSGGARIERDAESGTIPYWTFEVDLGVTYALSDSITFSVGPRWEYFEYLDASDDTLNAALARFGGDFDSSSYRLLSLDFGLVLDRRPDEYRARNASPNRGSFWALNVRQSLPIPSFTDINDIASSFLYLRADGEVRAWTPLWPDRERKGSPMVLGGRLHGVAVLPEREGSALPYPDLAFLGGPNSMRGYRSEQVGPYDSVCSYPDTRPAPQHNNGDTTRVNRVYQPRRGSLAVEGLAEVKVPLAYGVSLAVFGDAGVLWQRPAATGGAAFLSWGAGGGIGARYASPIGPIRIDLAVRPTHPWDLGRAYNPSSGGTPGSQVRYFGCNPGDVLPRGFDLASGSLGARHRLAQGEDALPVAFNLILAIGEAF